LWITSNYGAAAQPITCEKLLIAANNKIMGIPHCGHTTCGANAIQIKTKFVTFFWMVYRLETAPLKPEFRCLLVPEFGPNMDR
jgi:hypothetical protein